MTTTGKREDRRIQRTRQLLQKGFVEVIREKGFAAMSIQDIAERANVSRGTFYIHYTDKYMLLDQIVRGNFGQMLTDAVPPDPRWDKGTLRLIVLTVFECFEMKYKHRQPTSRLPVAQLEQTIHGELTNYLTRLIKKDHCDGIHEAAQLEARARVVTWAILGPAIEWAQEPVTISKDQMAYAILSVIMERTDH